MSKTINVNLGDTPQQAPRQVNWKRRIIAYLLFFVIGALSFYFLFSKNYKKTIFQKNQEIQQMEQKIDTLYQQIDGYDHQIDSLSDARIENEIKLKRHLDSLVKLNASQSQLFFDLKYQHEESTEKIIKIDTITANRVIQDVAKIEFLEKEIVLQDSIIVQQQLKIEDLEAVIHHRRDQVHLLTNQVECYQHQIKRKCGFFCGKRKILRRLKQCQHHE